MFNPDPRQKKILYLLAVEGYTQERVAAEIGLGYETVKKLCQGMRRDLGVDSFYQVIAIAVSMKWIPPLRPDTQKGINVFSSK